jgi:quercetin dioxygenase-like cupin family protein
MRTDSTTDAYTAAHEDDLAREGGWRLVRRTLGLSAFGMNLVEVAPGGDLPAHDERDPDQEEVYFVLAGRPTIRIGEEEHEAGPGTFVRISPEPIRSVVNSGHEPARLLMVSAPTASGFEPQDWA